MGCCGVSKKRKCEGCKGHGEKIQTNIEKLMTGQHVSMGREPGANRYTSNNFNPRGQSSSDRGRRAGGGVRRSPEYVAPLTTAEVADFVLPQDRLPFVLAASMYGKPPDVIEDYIRVKSDSATVQTWIHRFKLNCIIALRGTDILAEDGINNILDDLVVAGLAGVNQCALTITNQALEVVRDLEQRGFEEIVVTGHSLGGSGAFCVSSQSSKIVRAVCFNGGAPVTNPVYQGAGPQKNMFYHIAGDIISTHMFPMASTVLRIQRVNGEQIPYKAATEVYSETYKQDSTKNPFTNRGSRDPNASTAKERAEMYNTSNVNRGSRDPNSLTVHQQDGIDWYSSYNHSTDRFLKNDQYPWKIIDAQWEQNSLMHALDQGPIVASYLAGGLINPKLDVIKRLKELVCGNPIPGALPGPYCKEDDKVLEGVVGGLIGGLIGFFVSGGPGAVAGAMAGINLFRGEASVLQYANPAAFMQVDNLINKTEQTIKDAANEAQSLAKQ